MNWTESERRAWAPPARVSVSEWAAAHRRIVAKDAAEPGPWRNERAPYLREVMDALGPDDPVEEVYFQKAARIGGSEALRNAIAFWADQDPGPALLVYPTEAAAKEQLSKELIPIIQETPRLAHALVGADLKQHEVDLVRMSIYAAWAGSPQALSSRTIRYAIADEVDKFPPFSGREADPLSLMKRRTTTWGWRRKVYVTSTPTTRAGSISRAVEGCRDRRYYHVPCPGCGLLQRLVFAGLKWSPRRDGETRRDHAERIETEGDVWYECSGCRRRILEAEKSRILCSGRWLADGGAESERGAKRRAYFASAMYTLLGLGWAEIAAQFQRALAAREEGDLGPLLEFVTQVLGEPFEDQVWKVDETALAVKAARGHAPRVVPPWGGLLIATADTQKDHFIWAVWAWGRGERARWIDRGRAERFEDLERQALGARYPVEGFPNETMGVARLFIDAGGGGLSETGDSSRTDEVYRFALSRPGRVVPIKGWGGEGTPASLISQRRVNYKPPGVGRSPYDVTLLVLDTQSLKDILAAMIEQRVEDPAVERFQLCSDVDEDFSSQMTAERKIAVRRGGRVLERWERQHGRRADLWDCAVYQIAAAKVERVDMLPDEDQLVRERREAAERRAANAPYAAPPRPITKPDGRSFISRRS